MDAGWKGDYCIILAGGGTQNPLWLGLTVLKVTPAQRMPARTNTNKDAFHIIEDHISAVHCWNNIPSPSEEAQCEKVALLSQTE